MRVRKLPQSPPLSRYWAPKVWVTLTCTITRAGVLMGLDGTGGSRQRRPAEEIAEGGEREGAEQCDLS